MHKVPRAQPAQPAQRVQSDRRGLSARREHRDRSAQRDRKGRRAMPVKLVRKVPPVRTARKEPKVIPARLALWEPLERREHKAPSVIRARPVRRDYREFPVPSAR